MLRIIRIIVNSCHRRELVEAFDQHSLCVHIRKAQRAFDQRHTALTPPSHHCIDQGATHVFVIDKVYPTEAHTLSVPLLIGTMINDGSYSSHQLIVFVCEEILGFTEVESCVFVFAQRVHLIAEQVWRIVFVTLVQIVMQVDERL